MVADSEKRVERNRREIGQFPMLFAVCVRFFFSLSFLPEEKF